MFKPIPWGLIEREKEAKKIMKVLKDIYGDLSSLTKFAEVIRLAVKDGLISEEEKQMIYPFVHFRHEK